MKKELILVIQSVEFSDPKSGYLTVVGITEENITVKVRGYELPRTPGIKVKINDYEINRFKDIIVKNFVIVGMKKEIAFSYLQLGGFSTPNVESFLKNRKLNLGGKLQNLQKEVSFVESMYSKRAKEVLIEYNYFLYETLREIATYNYIKNYTHKKISRTTLVNASKQIDKLRVNPFNLLVYSEFTRDGIVSREISKLTKSQYENISYRKAVINNLECKHFVMLIERLKDLTKSNVFNYDLVNRQYREFSEENFPVELLNNNYIKSFKIKNDIYVMLKEDYLANIKVAKKIKLLSEGTKHINKEHVLSLCEGLHEHQRDAVVETLTKHFNVVTGGPGTGKSTTLNTMLNYLKSENKEFLLLAPTGKASQRMSEATGEHSQTIHSYFKLKTDKDVYGGEKINNTHIFVDEASMVSEELFFSIVKSIGRGSSLTLLGDVNQLECIGTGKILKDLINSKSVPVTRLTKVFRQKGDNPIVKNAYLVNQGKEGLIYNDDFQKIVVDGNSKESSLIEKFKELSMMYGIDNVVVLTPYRKKNIMFSAENINAAIKESMKINSQKKLFGFNVGDRVMQNANNRKLGVTNGLVGKVVSMEITKEREYISVEYPSGQEVIYGREDAKELSLAYATTIHKSQGSEYKVVILVCLQEHMKMLNRQMVYTAITRAKNKVVLFESNNALLTSSRKVGEDRATFLKVALKNTKK